MKFSAPATALFLAGSAMAFPGTPKLTGLKNPVHLVGRSKTPVGGNIFGSENVAGVIYNGQDITKAGATIKVPSPSSDGQGGAWVGIDGATCTDSYLQAGVAWEKTGSTSNFYAWYDWNPASQVNIPAAQFAVAAGDSIQVSVTATATGGVVAIQNSSTGKSFSYTFSKPAGKLCKQNAMYMVQDFEKIKGKAAPFANFGSIKFSSVSGIQGGAAINIKDGASDIAVLTDDQKGMDYTETSFTSGEITILYKPHKTPA